MLKVRVAKQFKKNYKQAQKRGFNMLLLDNIIIQLANEKPLDAKHKDHALKGTLKDYRECHVTPDWLLMYKIEKTILTLTLIDTGSHANLFG